MTGREPLETVLAKHRADQWSCSCGWPLNDSVGSWTEHLAAAVRSWLAGALTQPEVVEAAQRVYTRMQYTRDDDPAWERSMPAALAAAAEAVFGTSPDHEPCTEFGSHPRGGHEAEVKNHGRAR